MSDTTAPTRGTIRGLWRDLRQFVHDYRLHRRTLKIWRKTRPEQQLAFFMTILAADPGMRDAFRRALRVKGIPESQQDDRRVIPASEMASRAAALRGRIQA